MRVLLDTNVFLRWVDDSPDLGRKARSVVANPANECYLSIASVWELAIKSSLGKLKLALPVTRYVKDHMAANGFQLLGMEIKHMGRIETLPFHHRDPFDRLLIAQAFEEKMAVVTADSLFRQYGVKIIW